MVPALLVLALLMLAPVASAQSNEADVSDAPGDVALTSAALVPQPGPIADLADLIGVQAVPTTSSVSITIQVVSLAGTTILDTAGGDLRCWADFAVLANNASTTEWTARATYWPGAGGWSFLAGQVGEDSQDSMEWADMQGNVDEDNGQMTVEIPYDFLAAGPGDQLTLGVTSCFAIPGGNTQVQYFDRTETAKASTPVGPPNNGSSAQVTDSETTGPSEQETPALGLAFLAVALALFARRRR